MPARRNLTTIPGAFAPRRSLRLGAPRGLGLHSLPVGSAFVSPCSVHVACARSFKLGNRHPWLCPIFTSPSWLGMEYYLNFRQSNRFHDFKHRTATSCYFSRNCGVPFAECAAARVSYKSASVKAAKNVPGLAGRAAIRQQAAKGGKESALRSQF